MRVILRTLRTRYFAYVSLFIWSRESLGENHQKFAQFQQDVLLRTKLKLQEWLVVTLNNSLALLIQPVSQ